MAKSRKILNRAYGVEPSWGGDEEHILNNINWYVTAHETRNYKKWTLDWVKDGRSSWTEEDYDYIRRNPNKEFRYTGHYCRMLSRGYPQVDLLTAPLERLFPEMITRGKRKKNASVEKGTPNPHDRVLNQAHELAGDLNEIIDNANDSIRSNTDYYKKMSIFKWLKSKSVGHRQARYLSEIFTPNIEELDLLIEGKDVDLKEGYLYLTRPQQKKYHAFIKSLVDDCIRYANENKPIIVRRTKRRDPAKIVSKVKYQETSSEYGLRSEPPQEIIESIKVVVFNTKYNVLCVYCAKENNTLSIKGTTIINFDESKSECRTIKKPKALIRTIKNEKSLSSVWSSQTSVIKQPNGRLNEFSSIVKVFK